MSYPINVQLTVKGISITEDETLALQTKWDAIQALKHDFDEINKNVSDIAICIIPGGSGKNE